MFVSERRVRCTECGEFIEPGQLASFSYNRYKHVICPYPEDK